MGVEPYLVASSVEAILAQRLIRRICPKCGIPEADGKRRLGKGCEACRETGYHGRQAIFEMLEMTDPIRRLVLDSASSGEIREEARKRGWRSLSEDGHRLVDSGVTTWEEVMRVTKDSSETY
jgi:type II secretory ATPase GspE/PulE/Tfp pilus assembly ATPase PilB-like protein